MKQDVPSFLQEQYADAMQKASGQDKPQSDLDAGMAGRIDIIIKHSERNKGVMTVVLTSMVYKMLHPEQDIRLHQSSIPNGYSGRTFDHTYITPFLKSCKFPAMSESGWLTRSLEQKVPFDKNYTGAITPKLLKQTFLQTMDDIQNADCVSDMLDYILQALIIQRDRKDIRIAQPLNLSIDGIISLLDQHFHANYSASGAARLPVLAIYAVYESLIADGFKRFSSKSLLPLEKHTSADTQSGKIGDIDIVDEKGNAFEAVEIKFDIPINHNIVTIAKEKIQTSAVTRYYILSTKEPLRKDADTIKADIRQIKNTHGCQLIVNGIMPTLKYYLRLLDSTGTFIANYTRLLLKDTSIKFEHKQMWNDLVSKI